MIIGLFTFELHLPQAGSLKAKRQVVRRVKDRLRARHNLAVLELGTDSELWQRAGLAVVSIATRREVLVRLFDSIEEETRAHIPGELIETGREYLDAVDGGPTGWSEDW